MINKIIFKIIKLIILILKKTNLDKSIFDKLIFYIGLNQISENKKIYSNIDNIQKVELKVFSQNGEDGIIDFLLDKYCPVILFLSFLISSKVPCAVI